MTAVLADPTSKEHDTGPQHPERPERFDAAALAIADWPLITASRAATEDELALVHSRRYIRTARRECEQGLDELSTGDTPIMPRSFEVALRAVGTALTAVDLVFQGEADNAFCIVRPPGHHATPDRGMGFCMFNNVAIAARYAQSKYGAKRVLIADWDVHHGNGTQDIFYEDGSVLFFSTHEHPLYPGTGASQETGGGPGDGCTINCPFPAGSARAEILGAFEQKLVPAADRFRPDLVLISAGFDSRIGDPLGHFRLTDEDFADLTRVMLAIAAQHAGGKLVSVLEGGYNLAGLTAAVHAHVKVLAGDLATARPESLKP